MTQGGYGGNQQGGYGQPHGGYGAPGGYGGPGYGQPGGRSFGVVGALLVVLGAVAGIIAFTATNWYKGNHDSKTSDVNDILDKLDSADAANGLSIAYFGWLGWVLLAAATVLALAACAPSSASVFLRPLGAFVAFSGIALTVLSLKLTSNAERAGSSYTDLSDYIKDAAKAPSLYLIAGGFLVIAIGSIIGPQRRR